MVTATLVFHAGLGVLKPFLTGIERIAADSATMVSVDLGRGILTRKVTVSLEAPRSTVEHISRRISDLAEAFPQMGLQ